MFSILSSCASKEVKCETCDKINDNAVVIFQEGDTAKALAIFDSLSKAKPDYLSSFLNKGYLLEQLGEYDSALYYYSICIDKNNEFMNALYNRGALHQKFSNNNLAYEDYLKLYELGYEKKALFLDLSQLLHDKGETEKAIEVVNQGLKTYDKFSFGYDKKATFLMDQKKFKDAYDNQTIAINIKPQTAAYYNSRASILNNMKRYNDAIEDCKKAISIDSLYPYTYNTLGNSYEIIDSIKESLYMYDKAIKLKPDFAIAFLNKGILFINIKDTVQACEYISAGINLGEVFSNNEYNEFYLKNCK